MANPLKGQVAVKVGGRDLILAFSVEAVINLEDHLGMTVLEIGAMVPKIRTHRFLRAWLWAALIEHQSDDTGHPEFSVRQAGELFLEDGAGALGLALIQAWGACWPIVVEGEADGDRPPTPSRPTTDAAAGTGKASSRSGASSGSGRRKASGG